MKLIALFLISLILVAGCKNYNIEKKKPQPKEIKILRDVTGLEQSKKFIK